MFDESSCYIMCIFDKEADDKNKHDPFRNKQNKYYYFWFLHARLKILSQKTNTDHWHGYSLIIFVTHTTI